MSGRAAHALSWICAVTTAIAALACGDRAPPALWPEPPPPTLAAPIGVDESEGEGEMRARDAPPAEDVDEKPRSKLPPSRPPASEAPPSESPPAAATKPPSAAEGGTDR